MNDKTNPNGFTSKLCQKIIKIVNISSTTSTNVDFICCCFETLRNKVLNNCHSFDLFRRGFTIDNIRLIGLSVRDKDYSHLLQIVDSHPTVLNL